MHAVLRGELREGETKVLPGFNSRIPASIHGIDERILNPPATWSDRAAYDRHARELIERSRDDFKRFKVSPEIGAAGPST